MRSSRDQLEALRTMSIGIIEKRIFSGKRFDEMLQWCDERKQRELHLQVSGILHKLPSKDPIDVEGRLIGTRKGLFTKRIAILVESLDKPLQEMGLGNIITIGGEGARNEDVAAKKILVFELVKRDLHEDVYYDGDQINEAVKFITSVGKTEDFNVEVWGKDFKTRKPAYLKGRLINARVEFPNIELLELMVEGRSDEEEIVTVGGHEPPAISILQSSLDRVQPDLIAEKLYFWPIYSPETLRFADIVEANNITVRLGGKMIIENVSFSIREGEIMGIVGESGAGKTTMIKALIREFEPESGTASIAGINTSNLSKVKPLLGFVPQELSKMYEDFIQILPKIVSPIRV